MLQRCRHICNTCFARTVMQRESALIYQASAPRPQRAS